MPPWIISANAISLSVIGRPQAFVWTGRGHVDDLIADLVEKVRSAPAVEQFALRAQPGVILRDKNELLRVLALQRANQLTVIAALRNLFVSPTVKCEDRLERFEILLWIDLFRVHRTSGFDRFGDQ